MCGTILAPLDGSGLAERALPYAAALARALGARVSALHVASACDPPRRPTVDPVAREFTAASLRAEGVVGTSLACDADIGGPGEEIAAAALLEHADLVVMATHGATAPGHWFHDSVTVEVLRRSQVPVLVVTPLSERPWPDGAPRRILVPLDGSPVSEEALVTASDLARRFDAEVRAVHVVETRTRAAFAGLGYTEPAPELALAKAGHYLASVASRFVHLAPRISTSAVSGDPTATIASEARTWGADLIAMTTHAGVGLARVEPGSVAGGTLLHAPVPILFISPHTTRDRGASTRTAHP